jgi:hypothetical protein
MHDYYSGLSPESLSVTADIEIDGVEAGDNLGPRFREQSPGVWELTLAKPIAGLQEGTLTISVADQQGNKTEIVRTFSAK